MFGIVFNLLRRCSDKLALPNHPTLQLIANSRKYRSRLKHMESVSHGRELMC
eukprot:m.243911 g.243911  ORF g.243911 m.243911 type:complete len:52 (+) comp40242_c1_seq3:1175-1330(+)